MSWIDNDELMDGASISITTITAVVHYLTRTLKGSQSRLDYGGSLVVVHFLSQGITQNDLLGAVIIGVVIGALIASVVFIGLLWRRRHHATPITTESDFKTSSSYDPVLQVVLDHIDLVEAITITSIFEAEHKAVMKESIQSYAKRVKNILGINKDKKPTIDIIVKENHVKLIPL